MNKVNELINKVTMKPFLTTNLRSKENDNAH